METAATPQEKMIPFSPVEFRVDADQAGIQAGCLVFAVATVVTFVILNLLLPEAAMLALILSLVCGAGTSYVVESRLKAKFSSGRTLFADNESIQIKHNGTNEASLDPRQQVNVLAWRFEVPRSGRIKKGWYVVALALEQDDTLLPFYTFSAPDRFKDVPLSNLFEPLQRADKLNKESGSAREMKLAGQQRRLHDAERVRHMQGAELSLEDFEQFVDHLQEHYPAWMSG